QPCRSRAVPRHGHAGRERGERMRIHAAVRRPSALAAGPFGQGVHRARLPEQRVRRAGAGLAGADQDLLRAELRCHLPDGRQARDQARPRTVADLCVSRARRGRAELELLQVRRGEGRRGTRFLSEQRGSRGSRAPARRRRRPGRIAAVEYLRLGNSGLKVSRICLGTMTLGRWGNTDHDDCIRIIRRALDEGITFIDTANRYGMGESEEIVGKGLEGRREEGVIARKVFMPGPGGVLDRGTSRRHVFLQVEESLRRLRTDWIDLYQIHRNDKDTPLEETLGALTDLVRQGKVRYLGVSTGTLVESRAMYFGGGQMVEALWISERRRLRRVVSAPPPLLILTRAAAREIL